MRKKAKKYVCMRCKRAFSSFDTLRVHSKKHLKREVLDELKLLESGHVPDQSKIGSDFKGKNKIIIS